MAVSGWWAVEASHTIMVGHQARAGNTRGIDKVSGRRLLPPEDILRNPIGVVELLLSIMHINNLCLLSLAFLGL